MASISRSIPPVSTTTLSYPASFNRNLASLTTRYVFPSECKDRWLVLTPEASPVYVYSTPFVGTSTDYHWKSCQPLGASQTYSPGVCPEEYTLARIWETQYASGGSLATRWDGSCCPSWLYDQNYAPCWGTITSTIPAFAPITSIYTLGTSTSLYLYYSSSTKDGDPMQYNITTLSSGSAIADPLYVAWESSDLAKFPVDYAVSLAKRIGVDFTPTPTPGSNSVPPTPASTSDLPRNTGSPGTLNTGSGGGLSTGAKAGIGVGASVGALILFGIIAVGVLVRRRAKKPAAYANNTGDDQPEWQVGATSQANRNSVLTSNGEMRQK